MALRKTFYFHSFYESSKRLIQAATKHNKPIGFSVKISPTAYENVLEVSITKCSPKDQFCKKTARAELENKPSKLIETKQLPYFIAELMNKYRLATGYNWKNFTYLYKYVL